MKEMCTMNQGKQRKPVKSRVITSVALAVAMVAGGLSSLSAEALVLGQVRVLSSLGEPLKAEIPISQITKDEAGSLAVTLASPSDFNSRGLIYTNMLSSVRLSYEMKGANSAVIYVRSARPMQEPFMDMLVDVRWRSGSVQRSYTMLIDPPKTIRTVSPNAIVPPGNEIKADGTIAPINPSQVVIETTGNNGQTTTTSMDGDVIRMQILEPGQTIGARRPAARPSQPATTNNNVSATPRSGSSVTVDRGQTLGKIAAAYKPANVSTEQMLAALYKANPSAFIDNNINWLRSGVTLRIPTNDEIASISKTEARSLVSSHARQFNQRRSQLAGMPVRVVPQAQGGASGGTVGTIQAGGPSQQTTDHLIINTVNDPSTQIATESAQRQENIARQAEVSALQKEIEELKGQIAEIRAAETVQPDTSRSVDVGNNSTPLSTNVQAGGNNGSAEPSQNPPLVANTTPAPTVEQTPAPTVEQTPAPTVEQTPAPTVEQTPAPTVEQTPAPTVEQTPAPTVEQTPAPTVEPTPAQDNPQRYQYDASSQVLEKGIIDELLDNPLIPAAALGVIVILVGGVFVIRRRRNAAEEEEEFFDDIDDSTYEDEHQQGDSFMLDQSSSIYAASQLDANADVDPVQEADVYLAYGRDEQAAEILRDALSTDPDRIALHAKLCEVYARQNDIIAFEEQAMRLHSLTKGVGFEWERISRLAQSISPNKIGMLGSDIPDTKPPLTSAPTVVQKSVQDDEFSIGQMDYSPASQQQQSESFAAEDNGIADLDVSLDFSHSKSFDHENDYELSSADDPSFMLGDEDDEGPATRLALAEEFFAIGNKEDAKDIVEEVLHQNLSSEEKSRAKSLLDKMS